MPLQQDQQIEERREREREKEREREREREREISLAVLAANSISSSQGFLRGLVIVVMFQQVAQTTL